MNKVDEGFQGGNWMEECDEKEEKQRMAFNLDCLERIWLIDSNGNSQKILKQHSLSSGKGIFPPDIENKKKKKKQKTK